MKQLVIDQMKEYRAKNKVVKATPYKNGMEDGWLITFPDISDVSITEEFIKRVFESQEEAKAYMNTSAFDEYRDNDVICVVPIILSDPTVDEMDSINSIFIGGKEYNFEEIEDDMWLVLDEEAIEITLYYDFLDDYETVDKTAAHIGYDRDLEEVFLEVNNKRVVIDETDIATVEKLLDGFNIPYTERLGQAFWR